MRLTLLLLCAGLLWAQSSSDAPDRGLLSGIVLNSATGAPVRKARVRLMNLGAAPKTKVEGSAGGGTLTDAAGRFEFTALAPGSYALTASREGFESPNMHGEPKLLRLTVASGEEKNDVVMRLAPLGVISGRILDEDGDPLRRIEVQTMVYQYTAAGRRLSARDAATTDDLGEYRIYDVAPGHYCLKAGSAESMGGTAKESYGPSYYPGTPDALAATAIEVGAGQHVQGVDLTLHPTRIASIRGRVLNPGANLTVGLMKFSEGVSATSNMSVDDHDGRFVLGAVSPGPYILTAGSTVGGRHYSAHLPIQVGSADLDAIELRLAPPMDIAGQIRIEGKPAARMPRLYINLESDGRSLRNMAGGGPKEDDSFDLEGLEPGVYQVSAEAPDDLYLKAVRWADRDVMQSGLDLTQGAPDSRLVVVLSANGGQIDGLVEDDQPAPAAAATVVLVPSGAAPLKSSFKSAKTSPAGHFRMQGITPGSYQLFAWEEVDPNQVMYDPEFLKPFASRAESLEIAEGSRKSVRLKLIKP